MTVNVYYRGANVTSEARLVWPISDSFFHEYRSTIRMSFPTPPKMMTYMYLW